MSDKTKISIRFYGDREVRAVWDDENSKWWFSVLDIVGVLNNEDDYAKNRNYWKYLKNKLKTANPQLVSATNQLKLTAADGKKYNTDVLDNNGVIQLAQSMPNTKSAKFVEWFTYSDETFQFAMAQYLPQTLHTVERMPENTFDEIADKYVEMNIAHPFREGNGRSTRIWLDLMLKRTLKKCVDWSRIPKKAYLDAMVKSAVDTRQLKMLLSEALTDRINDREMFMKGIDYSYYYEENN